MEERQIETDIEEICSISSKERIVVQYIGGYLLNSISKLCCCTNELKSNTPPKFIQLKEYFPGILNYPAEWLTEKLVSLEITFKTIIKQYGIHIPNIVDFLKRERSIDINIKCSNEHKLLGEIVTERYYKLRMHYHIKWINLDKNQELYSKRKSHHALSKLIC